MKYIVILFLIPSFCSAADNAEWYVRDYYRNTPILAEIARCESTFRQFDGKGVLHGKVNPKDIGIMQINLDAHAKRAEKLGFDLYTTRGNLGYAKLLYQEKGAGPWIFSRDCWLKEV